MCPENHPLFAYKLPECPIHHQHYRISLWVQSCSVAFTMGILEQNIYNVTELLTIQKKLKEFKNNSIFFFLLGDQPV